MAVLFQAHLHHARRIVHWVSIVLVLFITACSSSPNETGAGGTPSVAANITPLALAPIASALHCPQNGSTQRPGVFIQSDGQHFTYDKKPILFTGFTFYPGSAGGAGAWRGAQFTTYIDHILDMGAQSGQNLIRPTDFWSKEATTQRVDDATIWHNLDYVVCAAQQRGIFVVMDISAFKWLLLSQGRDSADATIWQPFITTVAKHYRDATAIAFYSILGEPNPPKTPAASQTLVAFYRTLTDTLYAVDSHHLISAGGFNHMEDESPQIPWWHEIFALPHNDIVGFKTYSQHDINLMPTIAQYGQSLHKVLVDEEFGMPQHQGDATFVGGSGYNQITTSRAQFFDTVYKSGTSLGVAAFIFWNMGCEIKDTGYEVSPLTPAVWQVIMQHAAVSPTAATAVCG